MDSRRRRLDMRLDVAEEQEHDDREQAQFYQLRVAHEQRSLRLSERYKQWSLTTQILFWIAIASVLGGVAAGFACAVPFVFSVAALPLIKVLYVALMVAFNALMLAIWCDGKWAERPAKAQIPRTIFMTMLAFVACVLGTLLCSPSSLAVLPSMLDKLSPTAAAWLPGLKVAALAGITLLWGALTSGVSYLLACLAERYQKSRWGQFFKGTSWGFALAGAAVPMIFMAKFLAVQHLVAFFAQTLQHYGALVFAITLPSAVGVLGGFFNAIWQGGVADLSAIEVHYGHESRQVGRYSSPAIGGASTPDFFKSLANPGNHDSFVEKASHRSGQGEGVEPQVDNPYV